MLRIGHSHYKVPTTWSNAHCNPRTAGARTSCPLIHDVSVKHAMPKSGIDLWQSRPARAELHIAAALIGGLALDRLLGWPGQLLADFWVLAVFAWLLINSGNDERLALVICITLATLGEAFLSLVWGLYDYQFHNIPLFVPPGHAILMTLGILLAPRMPAWIVWAVPVAVLPYLVLELWRGPLMADAVLFATFVACLVGGKARMLYATMFVLSLLLELYGTWLGNWTWRNTLPWLYLSNTNPPVCAGAFYCMLDLLVMLSMNFFMGLDRKSRAGMN